MNNAQLKAILVSNMCPLGANLKEQENTRKSLFDSADAIMKECKLTLEVKNAKKEKA